MSQAIAGAAMLAGAAALLFVPGMAPFASLLVVHLVEAAFFSLLAAGVSMEAGAIAQAISDNRGVGITSRQAAGMRQIVYGQQRIGGTSIYQSTTGFGNSGTPVYNYVIVLASHALDGIVNLYLDGRVVPWSQQPSSSGQHANVGCGSVTVPPTSTVSISGGVITGITATGGSGFTGVKPQDGFRVVISDSGGGSGAEAWATNSGPGGWGNYFTVGAWTVTMTAGGQNYTSATVAEIQGAFTFGGSAAADEQNTLGAGYGLGYSIGPGGPHYDFAGKVYCEARFGDQLDGDTIAALTSFDSSWSASGAPGGQIQATATSIINPIAGTLVGVMMDVFGEGYVTAPSVEIAGATAVAYVSGGKVTGIEILSVTGGGFTEPPMVIIGPPNSGTGRGTVTPWVGGCAYIYLNIGYDQNNFPAPPEIRVTVTGKNDIYDPRTGARGYSTNWALQVADVINDPVFGLNDNTVNQAQLIAAANVCDESILTSQGAETNYSQHIHYDTTVSPGDALAMMMPAAAGRLSRIGGQWFIWPAYWQGPSFTMDESSLLDDIQWEPYRSARDLTNAVNGTYIAPNSPYNVAGNLYDANGWWYGETANLWPLAWQPTNFPQYACDPLHGYSTDVFLTADGGIRLPMELTLRGVISIVQAQRLAKIAMLRNRQQGTGTFKMGLTAWQMQPTDVMQFNFPLMGWADKYLEVDRIQFVAEPQQHGDTGEEGSMQLSLSLSVQETAASVYEWSESEELTPYDVPAAPGALSSVVPPPTSLTAVTNATTALVQSDGTVMPRVLVAWVPPADAYVNNGGSIQVQWQDHAGVYLSGVWIDAGTTSGNANSFLFEPASSVAYVNVQIRAIRSHGGASAWVTATDLLLPRPTLILHAGQPWLVNGV